MSLTTSKFCVLGAHILTSLTSSIQQIPNNSSKQSFQESLYLSNILSSSIPECVCMATFIALFYIVYLPVISLLKNLGSM